MSDRIEETHKLYRAAIEADDAFSEQCVRQFGNDACNARYHPKRHDAATRLASIAARKACDAYLAACRS